MSKINEIDPRFIDSLCDIRHQIKDAEKTLSDMKKKYGVEVRYSHTTLNSLEIGLNKLILNQFFNYDSEEFETYIDSTYNNLNIIESIALIETARRILVTIKYDIESFLYFKDLKKRLRDSELELNELEEKVALDNDKELTGNLCLKLKNVVVELRNINYELVEEKRSNSNSLILKAAVWAIPVLIGFYQLISMENLNFDPRYPLFAYPGLLVLVYLILKISNPRYYGKYVINNLINLKIWVFIFGGIALISFVKDFPDIDLLEISYDFIQLMSFVFVGYLVISVENARSDFIEKTKKSYFTNIKSILKDNTPYFELGLEFGFDET